MLTNLKSWITGLGVILFIAMGLSIAWLRVELAATTAGLQSAKDTIDTKQGQNKKLTEELAGRDSQIKQLQARARQNAALAAQASATIAGINGQLAARSQRIKQLEQRNEILRNWAVVHLPDPVIGLRKHPIFTGAAAYRAWLSAGDALPAAGGQPADQRPAQ